MREAAENAVSLPCPDIETYVLGAQYLDAADFVCDSVMETLIGIFDPAQAHSEVVCDWGIGAGKSFLVSVITTYMAYRVMCMGDPQEHYGLAPNSEISITNFSISEGQAKEVVFGEVQGLIDAAPCFAQPRFRPDPKIRSVLRWPQKHFAIRPGSSQYKKALGKNLIAAILDEAAFMEDVEGSIRVAGRIQHGRYDAAEEVFRAAQARVKSRGNADWRADGLVMMISSPRYIDDFIERKMREAETNPQIFACRIPTWMGAQAKTLCGETFDDPVLGPVPIEYQDDFKRNPESARRDLGAVPSEALEPFFTDRDALEAARNAALPDILAGAYPALAKGVTFSKARRFAHIDLGIVHDRCGVGVCHVERGRLVYDLLTYFTAADFSAEEVDLEAIRGLLIEMQEAGCHFRLVTYDGFQSADSRQLLKKAGIPTELYSVDRTTEAYEDLKSLVYAGQVQIPVTERSEMFWREARRLELIAGKKVDHPPKGSKDVTDAAAGAAHHAIQTLGLARPTVESIRGIVVAQQPALNMETGRIETPIVKPASEVRAVPELVAPMTRVEALYPGLAAARARRRPRERHTDDAQ